MSVSSLLLLIVKPGTDLPVLLSTTTSSQTQDDALPWYKTIASGRVQKHLMRFLNNFISQKDLEDELGLHMADVFYENETGPTMAALYEKLERRVGERCPDRVAEFREEVRFLRLWRVQRTVDDWRVTHHVCSLPFLCVMIIHNRLWLVYPV